MPRGRRFLVAVEAVVVVMVICLVDMGISGYLLFTNAGVDEVQHADAIIVLGGDHDGREDYGLSLARDGWARTVVISDPYGADDSVMRRVCHDTGDIEVICRRPSPMTTRGEAEMMRLLAQERRWTRIIVISWRYHLPRARLIFRQCFSGQPDSTVMLAVPRRYRYSLAGWELVYAYQFGGLAKAITLGECS
ncbi:MAG TPA: YdcF family protein [Mycobacterium sp.]|jgi:uncharacterized SAM-binding protein YcdF (DUF218 family)|nr:YdcF family protein [Mycobacterium sp.]